MLPFDNKHGWLFLGIAAFVSLALIFYMLKHYPSYERFFQAKVYADDSGRFLPYRIHIPANNDSNMKLPLVLFFHGAGQRGVDNKSQLSLGVPDILKFTIHRQQPAIIVAPQVPLQQQWVDKPWTSDEHSMPEQASVSMQLTIDLLQQLTASLPIDMNRLYVTGLSMGGFGVWDILQRHPDLFAAAVPVCGGGDVKYASRIKHIPVWAFHGDSDQVVKPQLSRNMINALKTAGGNPKYTEYKEQGHDSWVSAYQDEQMLDWLFAQVIQPQKLNTSP